MRLLGADRVELTSERLKPAAAAPRLTLIDGLRGFAAVAVLFYHYMHFAMIGTDHERYFEYLDYQPARAAFAILYDWGFYAVQLFWMISGFVFAAVYFGREATTREFVVNRFARLYPLHFLTLLVVAVLQFVAQILLQLRRAKQYFALMPRLGAGAHHNIHFGFYLGQRAEGADVVQYIAGPVRQNARLLVQVGVGIHHPQLVEAHGFYRAGSSAHIFRHRRFYQNNT